MPKQKFYVVWVGKEPGIYASWADCEQQIANVPGAKFKAFMSLPEAENAYKLGWKYVFAQTAVKAECNMDSVEMDSISVDVGSHGNPGPIEYKGVDTRTGEVLFSHGPIPRGTNNLGEFLAIVHALGYLHKQGSKKPVYSDSENAIKWVNRKQVSSTLVRDPSTTQVWELTDRAIRWLIAHPDHNPVLKWNTKEWGQIKADYGRK